MTDAPAYTVHDGAGPPPKWRRQIIAEWLTAHRIRPKDVSADHPILILNMPHREQADQPDQGQWTIQVISFVQYIRNEEDNIAAHPETGRPLTIQRTVPLQHAFPTDTTTDGEDHGQADGQAAEEAPEVLVRNQEQAGVSHRYEGQSPERPGKGQSVRNQGAEEAGSSIGDQAVPDPEEDRRRPEEEVGGA